MRKLYGKIDGRLITKEFFPEYIGCEGDINKGDCYRWAYIAYMIYEGVELYSNEYHAFVYQRGLFFDSESPHGERSASRLSCNEMNGIEYSDWQDVDEFEEFWNDNGTFDDRIELDKRIRKFWQKRSGKKINNSTMIAA